MINALSNQITFLRDFNSKHKQSGCVKPNKSGQTLANIANDLKLFYVNQLDPNRHTRDDLFHGTSDILDMAFLSQGLSSQDISFSVADNHMASDHFFSQISLDKPLKLDTPLTEPRYRSDKTNDDLLPSSLKDSLTNIDTDVPTKDELEELAVTLCISQFQEPTSPGRAPGFCTLLLPRGRDLYLMTFPGGRVFAYP